MTKLAVKHSLTEGGGEAHNARDKNENMNSQMRLGTRRAWYERKIRSPYSLRVRPR